FSGSDVCFCRGSYNGGNAQSCRRGYRPACTRSDRRRAYSTESACCITENQTHSRRCSRLVSPRTADHVTHLIFCVRFIQPVVKHEPPGHSPPCLTNNHHHSQHGTH